MNSYKVRGTEVAVVAKAFRESYYKVLAPMLGQSWTKVLQKELQAIREFYLNDKKHIAFKRFNDLFVWQELLTKEAQQRFLENVVMLDKQAIDQVINKLEHFSEEGGDMRRELFDALAVNRKHYVIAQDLVSILNNMPTQWISFPQVDPRADRVTINYAIDGIDVRKQVLQMFGKDMFTIPCIDQCKRFMLTAIDWNATLENKKLTLHEDEERSEVDSTHIQDVLKRALDKKTVADQLVSYLNDSVDDEITNIEYVQVATPFFKKYIKQNLLSLLQILDKKGIKESFKNDADMLKATSEDLAAVLARTARAVMTDTSHSNNTAQEWFSAN